VSWDKDQYHYILAKDDNNSYSNYVVLIGESKNNDWSIQELSNN